MGKKRRADPNHDGVQNSVSVRKTRSKIAKDVGVLYGGAALPRTDTPTEVMNVKEDGGNGDAPTEVVNLNKDGGNGSSTGKRNGKATRCGKRDGELPTKLGHGKEAAAGQKWMPEDEISLCNVLLDLVRSGKEINLNMSEVHRALEGNYSKTQVYEKIRRMKKRFYFIKECAEKKGKYRAPPGKVIHQQKLYEIWKQIWTENEQAQAGEASSEDETAEKNKHGEASKAKAGALDQRWREMEMCEIKVFYQLLRLMQEQNNFILRHFKMQEDCLYSLKIV